jgi:predicted transcriptional regulator
VYFVSPIRYRDKSKTMKKKAKKPDSAGVNPASTKEKTGEVVGGWTFLTNHTHVLVCLFRNPDVTLREVASQVGITERMVQKIVSELVENNFAEVTRVGRRNTYRIHTNLHLRHPLESHRTIGELLQLLDR